ncbi:MAG TPA: KamA family radical SAM protein [Candidatus Atribacteria bacterium]|nr:MAG: Lysine 2,3-aminomutase [Atribacteria bacterium 34_128]HAJ31768.1 KamA family radical SAM protein [Candidatus Atribacteria bacterium]
MNKSLIEKLWRENPEIFKLLKESENLEEARQRLFKFSKDLEWKYREGEEVLHKLEYATALEAIKVFNNLISLRNEKIAGFSTLDYLRQVAKENQEIIHEIDEGFLEEVIHLFKAMKGKADISSGWLRPLLEKDGVKITDFAKIKGREAGISRSNYLDKLYEKVHNFIGRYPSGCDDELIKERKENRQKILEYFAATNDDWDDYRWHLKHIFHSMDDLEHLKKLVPLTEEDIEAIEIAIENKIPFGITPYYLSLFDFSHSDRKYDYQVRSQVIPPMHYVTLMKEHRKERSYYFDFMGEHDTSPEELITRRYPMISILKPYDTCPQICVYCQRNWEITGPMMPEGMVSKEALDKALDWFAEHTSMKDVLITGGDPLALNDELIKYIMNRLCEMDHVINIRWASRTPVTLPMRITDELTKLIGSYLKPGKRNICVVTHIEGASEVTPELAEAVMKFRRQGIYVYNQLVYTLETSRRFQNAAARIAMKKAGVDPYYTFYPKGKEETKDYLVPVARLWQERKEEARLLPGQFRTDEPVFNVPRLGKNHIRAWQDRELIALNKEGRRIYLWHPWEKGIALVEPYVYKDLPIYKYLQELAKRGEDIEEYKSIWYYY